MLYTIGPLANPLREFVFMVLMSMAHRTNAASVRARSRFRGNRGAWRAARVRHGAPSHPAPRVTARRATGRRLGGGGQAPAGLAAAAGDDIGAVERGLHAHERLALHCDAPAKGAGRSAGRGGWLSSGAEWVAHAVGLPADMGIGGQRVDGGVQNAVDHGHQQAHAVVHPQVQQIGVLDRQL